MCVHVFVCLWLSQFKCAMAIAESTKYVNMNDDEDQQRCDARKNNFNLGFKLTKISHNDPSTSFALFCFFVCVCRKKMKKINNSKGNFSDSETNINYIFLGSFTMQTVIFYDCSCNSQHTFSPFNVANPSKIFRAKYAVDSIIPFVVCYQSINFYRYFSIISL